MKCPILYISYDGMMEPLGQSQVLQYLKVLADEHKIILISFEKAHDWNDRERRDAVWKEVRAEGIQWRPLRYHRSPSALATAYDLLVGILVAGWFCWRYRAAVVHARSYVPSVIALCLKWLFNTKFIFDMRGFWADEKVNGGQWAANGILYRVAKWFERRFLLRADRVVSLTEAAVNEIHTFDYLQGRMPKCEVITTCANLSHFSDHATRLPVEASGTFTLGYVGAASYSYLLDEALMAYKCLKEIVGDARFLILNRGEHDFIRERLKYHGIDPLCVELKAANYRELPKELSKMDASVFFIRQTYSKVASSPTKLGELLGCGVPCLSNTGIGDMTAIIDGEGVGVVVKDFREESIREGVKGLIELARRPEIRYRCRRAAEKHFALEKGVQMYAAIYEELSRDQRLSVTP